MSNSPDSQNRTQWHHSEAGNEATNRGLRPVYPSWVVALLGIFIAVVSVAVWSVVGMAVYKGFGSSNSVDRRAEDDDAKGLTSTSGWELDSVITDACEGSFTIVHNGASDNANPYLESWTCASVPDTMLTEFDFYVYEDAEVAYQQATFTELFDAYFVSDLTNGTAVLGAVYSLEDGFRTFETLDKSNLKIDELADKYELEVDRIPHDPDSQY